MLRFLSAVLKILKLLKLRFVASALTFPQAHTQQKNEQGAESDRRYPSDTASRRGGERGR